jgi:hypothetical protein
MELDRGIHPTSRQDISSLSTTDGESETNCEPPPLFDRRTCSNLSQELSLLMLSSVIGSTESITGLCPEFEPKRYLRAVFYEKKSDMNLSKTYETSSA